MKESIIEGTERQEPLRDGYLHVEQDGVLKAVHSDSQRWNRMDVRRIYRGEK